MKGHAAADGMMATAKSELNSGLRHVPVGSKERIHLDLNASNATRCRRLMCAEVELRRCDLVAHRCALLGKERGLFLAPGANYNCSISVALSDH